MNVEMLNTRINEIDNIIKQYTENHVQLTNLIHIANGAKQECVIWLNKLTSETSSSQVDSEQTTQPKKSGRPKAKL